MFIYIVRDVEDRSIEFIYDEETFKKEYIKYLSASYKDSWMRWQDVLKCKINSDNYESIDVKDILELFENND